MNEFQLLGGLVLQTSLPMPDVAALTKFVEDLQRATKRKTLLDLWDALPAHEAGGDCAGSLRAMLLFSEVGDEIRATRTGR